MSVDGGELKEMPDQGAANEENRLLDKLLSMFKTDKPEPESEEEGDDDDDDDDDVDDGDDGGDRDFEPFEDVTSSDSSEDADYEDNLIIDEVSKAAPSTSHLQIKPYIPLKIEPINLHELGSLTNLVQLLSIEEFDLVTDCKDPELKELLVLNRAKNMQIKTLIKVYRYKLSQCESDLHNLRTKSMESSKEVHLFYRFGYPYFTYKHSRPPSNKDYFKKKANNIINFNYDRKRIVWTDHFMNKLKICVIYNYYTNQLKSDENDKDIRYSLDLLKQNLDIVKPPDLWDDTDIDWNHIADNNFMGWAPTECLRAMWNMYVHPSINRSKFTEKEITQINAYVKEHKAQDWEVCAERLKTNRSQYQVCVQYQKSRMDGIDTDVKDTEYTTQTRRRAYYARDMKNCTLGHFTAEENFKLIRLVKKYGEDFKRICEHMPNRSMDQIKHRYQDTMLQKNRRLANYTNDEDDAILDHVKQHGEKEWHRLAKRLPRNAAQLRHRYHRLRKWREANPNESVRSMPSRSRSTASISMQKRLAKYHKLVNSDVDELPLGPNPLQRILSNVDDRLVRFFMCTARLKTGRKVINVDERRLNACYTTVKSLLNILQATLDIPEDLSRVSFYHDIDEVDVEILHELRDAPDRAVAKMGDIVVPPNLCSAQALRFLLLQSFNFDDDAPKIEKITPELRLFKERFKSFFRVPSLMSIVEPPKQICVLKPVKPEPEQVKKRPVGRPRKDLSKINRMNAAKKAKSTSTVELEEPVEPEQSSASCTYFTQPARLSFVFQGGVLVPDEMPAESEVKEVEKEVQPLVLRKVDKMTIQRLREQNRLKITKVIKQSVQILNVDEGASSKNVSNINTIKKRSASDDNEDDKFDVKRVKSEQTLDCIIIN